MIKTLTAVLILFAVTSVAHAEPSTLPSFSLPDPQGGMHSSAQLVKNGLVIVVNAPTLHDKGEQENWSKLLTAAKGSHKGSFIFIEDMTASLFKGTVRKDMKKSWKPGDSPTLLIDSSGKTREAFGVAKDGTKVFVYDKNGKLLYSDAGSPSASSAKSIWGQLTH